MEFIPAEETHYEAIAHLITSPEELALMCPDGHYPLTIEQLRTTAQKRHNLTVGLIQGKVVAFSNLYDVQPSQAAFIGNVIVSKVARGQGIGQALIRHMMLICYQHHQACPHLSVMNTNTPALLLYIKLGFSPYAIDPWVSETGEPFAIIHMQHSSKDREH